MAAVSITDAQVLPSANATIRTGVVTAATTVVPGDVLYVVAADLTLGLASAASAGSAVIAAIAGMALCGGSAGQTIRYVSEDPALQIGTGASVTAGMVLYLDDGVPGGLVTTFAELDSTDFVSVFGVVSAATLGVVNMKIINSGVAKA